MSAKQAIGRAFEKIFTKKYKVKEQSNSGAGKFYKMDAEGKIFLYSLKATANESFRVTKKDLDEVRDATIGPGGTGAIPALITCLVQKKAPEPSDPIYVTLEFDDLVSLMSEDARAFKVSSDTEKLYNSSIPSLFKDKDD